MKIYTWPIRVYYEDTDSGGVVYYANYLKFLERARTEWLRHLGLEQDRLARDHGILFAVRAAALDYVHPARFNDCLLATAAVADYGKVSLTFAQQVRLMSDRADTAARGGFVSNLEGEVLCEARIKIACLDVATFRPRRMPDSVYEEIVSGR